VIGCLRAAQKAAIGLAKKGLVIGWLRAWGEPPGGLAPVSSLRRITHINSKR